MIDDLISRKAAVDELIERIRANGYTNAALISELKRSIGYLMLLPSADAFPVVRCKDCKWWREETDHTCRKWGGASPRKANGYCDEGERRENERTD